MEGNRPSIHGPARPCCDGSHLISTTRQHAHANKWTDSAAAERLILGRLHHAALLVLGRYANTDTAASKSTRKCPANVAATAAAETTTAESRTCEATAAPGKPDARPAKGKSAAAATATAAAWKSSAATSKARWAAFDTATNGLYGPSRSPCYYCTKSATSPTVVSSDQDVGSAQTVASAISRLHSTNQSH